LRQYRGSHNHTENACPPPKVPEYASVIWREMFVLNYLSHG
jgi:hypothetical protein